MLKLSRVVAVGVVALLVALAACGGGLVGDDEAKSVLAEDPWLPPSMEALGSGGDRVVLSWDVALDDVKVEGFTCPGEGVEFRRRWTDGGDPSSWPYVDHSVCRYSVASTADEHFLSTSTAEAFGDWQANFAKPDSVLGGKAAIYPAPAPSLTLVAERFEIACGEGDARHVCSSWFYRGLYGPVVSQVSFVSRGGGITYEEFARVVTSIDAEVAKALSAS